MMDGVFVQESVGVAFFDHSQGCSSWAVSSSKIVQAAESAISNYICSEINRPDYYRYQEALFILEWIWNWKGQASLHTQTLPGSLDQAYAISRSLTSWGDDAGGAGWSMGLGPMKCCFCTADVIFSTRTTPSESLRTMAANLAMALEAQKRCWAKTLPEDAGKHLAHVVCKYVIYLYMFAQICVCCYMIVHVHVMFARIGRCVDFPTADWWPDSFKFFVPSYDFRSISLWIQGFPEACRVGRAVVQK